MSRSAVTISLFAVVSVAVVVAVLVRHRHATVPAGRMPATAAWPPFPPGYGEKVRKITALLESAPASQPSASDTAELFDQALHDPDFRIRVRAMAVLPFVSDRQKAIDVLTACVYDRESEASGGGNVPLYATAYLADMNAARAIPAVEDWIAYLKKAPPYDENMRATMLNKSSQDLARLKQAAATRPAP